MKDCQAPPTASCCSAIHLMDMASGGLKTCPKAEHKLGPQSCECTYPYEGTLYVRGPSFSDLTNATVFHILEMSMWTKLRLTLGSVSLEDLFFNADDYLEMHLALFPSQGVYFNTTEMQIIGFDLSNQTYKLPAGCGFGPYYFIADPYIFADFGDSLDLFLIVQMGRAFQFPYQGLPAQRT